jgi:hypothetical protein
LADAKDIAFLDRLGSLIEVHRAMIKPFRRIVVVSPANRTELENGEVLSE